MLKNFSTFLTTTLLLSLPAIAQERTISFEDIILPPNTNYLMFNEEIVPDGPISIISFDDQNEIKINLLGSIEYSFLSGFDISNVTDEAYNNYLTPLAAQPFVGANETTNYAVGFVNVDFMGENPTTTIPIEAIFENIPSELGLEYMYITNTSYTYNYIQTQYPGQQFYCDLIIKGFSGEDFIDSIVVNLADFRNNNDYILEEWKMIHLSSLANADKLTFDINSNDTTGGFGINTPAYFAMDEITFTSTISIDEGAPKLFKIYPNPTPGVLHFSEKANHITLFNPLGQVVLLSDSTQILDISHLPNGLYYIHLENDNGEKYIQSITKE